MITIQQMLEKLLADKTVEDLEEILNILPEDQEGAIDTFCDELELGDWFYDALIENDVDIQSEIEKIRDEADAEHVRQLQDSFADERDLRAQQGWAL